METTVKLEVGDEFLTSVVFGSVDYPYLMELKFSFNGDGIILFDKNSGVKLSSGSLQ